MHSENINFRKTMLIIAFFSTNGKQNYIFYLENLGEIS